MEGPVQKKSKKSIFSPFFDTEEVFCVFGQKKIREFVKNKKIKEL